MTKEEIIEMGIQAGISEPVLLLGNNLKLLTAFAKLVAQHEREAVANWIMGKGFATGHGDTIVDMLDELEWQVAEREREACAKRLEAVGCHHCAENIRRKGQE